MNHPARVPVNLGRLPGIGQIGIVVTDTAEAMIAYSTYLGVPRWYRSRTEHRETFYRGEISGLELDIVVGYAGRVQIELIRVVNHGSGNVYQQILGADGRGFHHFGFIVRNIDDHVALLEQSDVEVLQASTLQNVGGVVIRTAFLDTTSSCGFLTELIEARFHGISVGMPQWLARIGTLLGNIELLEAP
jgi:catechol 2,3-dioxygenase-like lactoylglutathione lyase family enzyme